MAAHREILINFFERYPSAMGMSHAGGQYRLICPQCGDMVSVAELNDDAPQIDVVCGNCGYEDHLTDMIGVNGVDVVPQHTNGATTAIGGYQLSRAHNALSA